MDATLHSYVGIDRRAVVCCISLSMAHLVAQAPARSAPSAGGLERPELGCYVSKGSINGPICRAAHVSRKVDVFKVRKGQLCNRNRGT